MSLGHLSWRAVAPVGIAIGAIEALLLDPVLAWLTAEPLPRLWPERLVWAAVAGLLAAAALAFVASRIRSSREQRFVAFFVLLAGLDVAAQAQAAYFFTPDITAGTFTMIVIRIVVASAILAGLATMAFHSLAPDAPRAPGLHVSDLGWLWRIPAAAAIYFLLFLAAGLLIWPFVREFYADQLAEGRLGLLNFEWEYLNGVWFALLVLPVLRLAAGDWLRAGITAGLALMLIRGVAGLIVPSPALPIDIRLWHLIEVSWSNFVYGLAVAYIFVRPPRHLSRAQAGPACPQSDSASG